MKIDRIKTAAKEKGVTLKFLCDKIGKRRTYIGETEIRGGTIPDSELKIIADVLDTTPEYLRGETDKKEKPSKNGELSQMEKEMLRRLTALAPEMQDKAMEFLALLQDAQDKQGK